MAEPVMVPLTVAWTTFEAKVVSARLGAAGILTQLRGDSEGPYPLPGPVVVLVEAGEAEDARQLLLADRVEAAYDELEGELAAIAEAMDEPRRNSADSSDGGPWA